MKKHQRITSTIEFQDIIEKKQYTANQAFVIYIQEKKRENARVGITVSKKMGNAVTRNKVKRQVRMMFQDFIKKEFRKDVICIVRQGYTQNDYEVNKKELELLLHKVNIIGDKPIKEKLDD